MKKIVLCITLPLFTFYISLTNAQQRQDSAETIPEFKNQGELEDYWAKKLFVTKYKRRSFKKYEGAIAVNNNTFKYGSTILTVLVAPEIRVLFNRGIIYPDILHEYHRRRIKLTKIKLRDTKSAPTFPEFTVDINNLTITGFKELTAIEEVPERRRFTFLLFTKGLLNPTIYYIELTNNKATTTLADFVKKAELSFVEQGSLII